MNKNTKALRKAIDKARKSGNTSITWTRPTHGYHNDPKGAWETITIPIR